MSNHLFDMLRSSSADRGTNSFIQTSIGEISFDAFFAGAAKAAQALLDEGLEPGDRIAAQVDKSVAALELYVGCIMAGGIFLPLNTGYTDEELTYFLADATPRVVICDPSRKKTISQLAGDTTVHDLDAGGHSSWSYVCNRSAPLAAPVPRNPEDLAAILYTSGTTGKPKGATLSHRALASNAAVLTEHWQFTSDDTLIHALPIFHTHGLFVATNVALFAASRILFHESFNADRIIADMPRATALMGVPTFYTRLLAHPALPSASTGMRLFVSGSAPLLAATHRDWKAATGHAILERYGMTETNMNTSNPYDGDRRPGTVGFPLPGIDLRISDPSTGAPLPKGEIGSIEVRGPNLFSGYWKMPDKTAEDMRPDGFFITGDLGVIDADGYVSIVGRSKDLVISGGFNVYPKEVEAVIDKLPGVAESAVIGLPHPDFGEGVAVVVVGDGTKALEPDSIRAALTGLAKFKQPKACFVVDALPRNTMGKVQKNVLRDRFADTFLPGDT